MVLSATVCPLKTTSGFGTTGNSVSERRLTSNASVTMERRDIWRKRLQQEGQHPLTGQRAANFRLLHGQPVSRTQASDPMTSRLPRYEANCVQCRCFQCGPVPLRSDIKGMELPPANILISLERQLIALQLCR